MTRKREVPQIAITEQVVSEQDASKELKEPMEVIENWPELQKLLNGASVEELFDKGWKPHLKTKTNGTQYITFRFHGEDAGSGRHVDTERGLGLHTPERWEALMSLFPEKALPEKVIRNSPEQQYQQRSSTGNRASVLTTKVGRIAPIGPSVQIKLGTLQWYTWVQQAAGYPGSLDDFINETVDSYFREHHHLELAVVIQGEEN